MAKRNDRKKQPPPPSSLSQPTSSGPAVSNPPLTAPTPDQSPILNVDRKGKERATDKSSTGADYPLPPYSLNASNTPLQEPVRWVYNYDHTDPLNFGFMFPVTPGTSTNYSNPGSYSVNSGVTSVASASAASRGHSNNSHSSLPEGLPQPISWDNLQWDPSLDDYIPDQQFADLKQLPLVEISQQNQSFPRSLPHRYSPSREISPTQQPVPPSEDQVWFFPPHTTNTPQNFQVPSVPDSRGWLLDEGSDVSYSFNGPVSTGPIFTPLVAAAAPPNLKRKRSSGASSTAAIPHLRTLSNRQLSSLCSRCRIYEKLSNFPGLCNSCLQISFNTWPSVMGTRNEGMESLVLFLMPSNMEEVMLSAPPSLPKSRSWRILPKNSNHKEYDFGSLVFQDRWTLSKQQAESTRLFGEDYAELADIAQLYQLSQPRPNKSLEASCTVLITVCELYKSFVNTNPAGPGAATPTISISKLLNNIRTARITIRHTFQQIQALALSPSGSRDRQDWFPAFLSASIMAITAVIFLDVLIACPSPYRERIWGTAWHERIVEMRNGGYGMLISLLRANSKGINPLKLDCWTRDTASSSSNLPTPSDPFINVTSDSYSPAAAASPGKKRRRTNVSEDEKARQNSIEMDAEKERNVLLGLNSPAALQGVIALKAWGTKHNDHLRQGEDMFSKSLYMLASMSPVAGLWRIFELE